MTTVKLRNFVFWAGCAGAAASAHALSLGNSSSQLVLGAPLDVRIPLLNASGDTAAQQCAQAEVWLGERRLHGVQVDTLGHALRVHSSRSVNEPLVTVRVQVGCSTHMARSYTFLADPPAGQPWTPQPLDLQTLAVAASAAKAAAPQPSAQRVVAQAAATAARPVRASKTPINPNALQEAAAATPVLRTADAGPVNTLLARAPASATTSAAATAATATTTPASAPVTPSSDPTPAPLSGDAVADAVTDAGFAPEEDALQVLLRNNAAVLEALDTQLNHMQGLRRLEQTEIASLRAQLEHAQTAERPLPRWLYALQGLLALSLGACVWLVVRLRQAKHTVAALQERIYGPSTDTLMAGGPAAVTDRDDLAPAPTDSPANAWSPRTAHSAAAVDRAATAATASGHPAPARIAVYPGRAGLELPNPPPMAPAHVGRAPAPRLNDSFEPLTAWPATSAVVPSKVAAAHGLPPSLGSSTAGKSGPMGIHGATPQPPAHAGSWPPVPGAAAPAGMAAAAPGTLPALLDLDDVLERAEFHDMVGEHDDAIALLQTQIDSHPASTPRAYLHLLQLYYRLGRSEAFEATRAAFEAHFNVNVPALSGFERKGRDLLTSPTEMLAQIEAQWPSAGVLTLLRQLIVRSPLTPPAEQGTRLDIAALEDLLLLHNVAQTTAPSDRGSLLGRLRTTPQEVPLPSLQLPTLTAPLSAPAPVHTAAATAAMAALNDDAALNALEPMADTPVIPADWMAPADAATGTPAAITDAADDEAASWLTPHSAPAAITEAAGAADQVAPALTDLPMLDMDEFLSAQRQVTSLGTVNAPVAALQAPALDTPPAPANAATATSPTSTLTVNAPVASV